MVTVSTLSHERGMSGASDASSELVDQVNRSGRAGDATMRSQLTSAYIRLELLKYVGRRVQSEPRADKGIPFRSLLRDGAQQQGEIR